MKLKEIIAEAIEQSSDSMSAADAIVDILGLTPSFVAMDDKGNAVGSTSTAEEAIRQAEALEGFKPYMTLISRGFEIGGR